MKTAKFFSVFFALLSVVLIVGTVALSFRSLDAPVKLLTSSENAETLAEDFMEAICRGDYSAAGSMMYGQPDLGTDRESAYAFGTILWDAFTDSLSYEFSGECYATDSGIARDVTITALDISAVMDPLKESTQTLLQKRAAAEEDLSKVYDENNNYQEAFVMDVLCDAVSQVLAENNYLTSWKVTLKLVYRDGQCWIMPEQALICAISGGIAQ